MKIELSFIRLYFDAWVRPRKVIQTILDNNPNYGVWPMVICFSIITALNPLDNLIWLKYIPIPFAVFTGPLLNMTLGIVFFIFYTWFIYWIGKLIGGKGTYKNVRSACAWGWYPPALLGVILNFIAEIPIWPRAMGVGADITSLMKQPIVSWPNALLIFSFLLTLWGLILALINIAQTHKISIWKSVFIYFVLLMLIVLLGMTTIFFTSNKEIETRALKSYERGEILFNQKNYKEAMWDYEEVIKFYGKPYTLWVDLAQNKEWICRAYLNDWTPVEGPLNADVRLLQPDIYSKYKAELIQITPIPQKPN